MPLASYPGASLVGARVRELVTDSRTQSLAILALRRRLDSTVCLTCMDLSIEAEAFGAEVMLGDDEVPTVVGRRVLGAEEASALGVPGVGTARTSVQLETVERLADSGEASMVIAGMTGPFSLASRLLGVSEAMAMTHEAPDVVQAVVRRATSFLEAYACALLAAGARGILLAEPSAGLMSPAALATFSSPYVRVIEGTVRRRGGTVILHHCSARLAHLPALLESGVSHLHFGAPMDLVAAMDRVPDEVTLFGNLDPAGVFLNGTPESVASATRALCERMIGRPNWVPSSGCDLPARVPVANVAAFVKEARVWRGTGAG